MGLNDRGEKVIRLSGKQLKATIETLVDEYMAKKIKAVMAKFSD